MTIRSVSLLAVSLCFLASESRAQLQVPNVGTLQPLTGESYWGELADDSYGAVTVGDFTGDGRLDAVVLERGSPMLLETPEAFYTSIYASVRAHAIATVRSGGSDLLASLGPDGLVLHRWDGGRGAFESETLALGPWRGGGALAAGDLDGDERGDLVGVALSDPLLVQVLLGSRSTSRLSQGTSFSFRTTTPTHSVFLLDWDGDGRDEIAVVTDRGVEVYTGNGRLLGGSTAVRAGALGATLRMSSSSRDQIAFVQDAAVGGGEEVYLFDSTGLEGPFALGTLGVVGLAAADEDGDGDEELLFSVTSAPAVYILKNLTGTGATFDPARHMRSIPVGDPARDPASNRAGLGVGDFDADGDLDLLVPIQGDATGPLPTLGAIPSSILILRGSLVEEDRLKAVITSSEYSFVMGVSLDIEIFWGAPQLVPTPRPDETLTLEAEFWHTGDMGIATETEPFLSLSSPLSPGMLGSFSFSTTQVDFTFPDMYSMVFRQVLRDSTGRRTWEGPAMTAIYSSPVQTSVLQALAGVRGFQQTVNSQTVGGGTSGDSINGGGITIGPNVPPFGAGNSPGK